MSAKHTPGPWRLDWLMVEDPSGGPRIANCNAIGDRPTDELKANASLIAAAPELLEALQERIDNDEQAAFEDWLRITCPSGDVESVQHQWEESSLYSDFLDDTAKARAAIAKAIGEPR